MDMDGWMVRRKVSDWLYYESLTVYAVMLTWVLGLTMRCVYGNRNWNRSLKTYHRWMDGWMDGR